jgi:primase-polymerase (primpol)-like protein
MIEQMEEALSRTRAEIQGVKAEYDRLKAQIMAYEQAISNLNAIENGEYTKVSNENAHKPRLRTRKDSHSLKDNIHEYFKERPRMLTSPKKLSKWLIEEKGWDEERLRTRISNLLRKIVKEEAWLNRAGHGKYQFVEAN